MSYDVLKKSMGKQFIVIVELYIDSCVNTYGVAPCTASIPGTGSQKCFNTLSSCQDTAHYDRGDEADRKIFRFATTRVDGIQQEGDSPTFPTLRSVDTAPTKLEPGKGFGIRSSVVMSIMDHPWTDIGTDPYVRDRTYSPDSQGSFWGKWLARNPNYEGRRVDVLTGYLTEAGAYIPSNFRRRTYQLNKINGPDPDGVVSIEAKDPLKKADVDKAQWPPASQAVLSTEMLDGDTTIFFGDPDGELAASLANDQPYIRVDDEIIKLLIVNDDGGGFYSAVVQRSTAPDIYDDSLNEQVQHDVGAAIQPCYFFNEARVDEVLLVLLRDAALIEPGYLPVATWDLAVQEGGLDNYLMTALLTEPTGVNDLLVELSQHGVYMWWDEREQEVLIKSLITQDFDGDPYNENTDIISGSIQVTRDVKNRVSQVTFYFGLRFPTMDLEQKTSYSAWQAKRDLQAESPEEYGQKKIVEIFSRWLPSQKAATASEIGTRLLRSYRDSKIILSMSLDPKDDDAWTGDVVGVVSALIQDSTGAPLSKNYLVLQVDEKIADSGVVYDYLMQGESTLRRAGVITPNQDIDILQFDGDDLYTGPELLVVGDGTAFPDYDVASAALKARYAFIAPDSGVFDDGKPAYQIR